MPTKKLMKMMWIRTTNMKMKKRSERRLKKRMEWTRKMNISNL